MPLQSADDGVLAAMGRPYTFAEYVAAVAQLRRRLPGLLLSTDVIVGFPTEDEAAFARTLAVLGEPAAPALAGPGGRLFGRVHLFAYSPRPGTAAAHRGSLPPAVVKARMRAAQAAARSAAGAARRRRPRAAGRGARRRAPRRPLARVQFDLRAVLSAGRGAPRRAGAGRRHRASTPTD